MMRRLRLAASTALMVLLIAAPQWAWAAETLDDEEESGDEPSEARDRVHGYLGFSGLGLFVTSQQTNYDRGFLADGGGFGIFGGIRLGSYISLETNWTLSYHDQQLDAAGRTLVLIDELYTMTLTGDIKLHIPSTCPVEPFLQAGVGGVWIGDTGTRGYFASGLAINAGGGLDIWLGPYVTVGARVLYRGFALGNVDIVPGYARQDYYVNAVSFDGSLAFHF